ASTPKAKSRKITRINNRFNPTSFTPAINNKATRTSSVNCLLEKMWHHALLSPNCRTPGHLDDAHVSNNVCCNVNRVRKTVYNENTDTHGLQLKNQHQHICIYGTATKSVNIVAHSFVKRWWGGLVMATMIGGGCSGREGTRDDDDDDHIGDFSVINHFCVMMIYPRPNGFQVTL
nr:hypothetical protein [Tanacetum cinerariifolium]